MSLSGRDSPFANSGLMITIAPEHFGKDDVFAGMRLQEVYEQKAFELGRGEYLCPIQDADRLSKPSADAHGCRRAAIRAGWCWPRIADLVPPVIRQALERGLADPESPLAGPLPQRGDAGRPRSAGQFPGANCSR